MGDLYSGSRNITGRIIFKKHMHLSGELLRASVSQEHCEGQPENEAESEAEVQGKDSSSLPGGGKLSNQLTFILQFSSTI